MRRTPFLITIDTEGDDLWSRPRQITTRNGKYLPRFQALCERFAFRPVYLTNYEMARCPYFVDLGRDIVARKAGEIGMHLHAWNSPPLVPLTDDDFQYQPYLTEYPIPVMREKIHVLTELLRDVFGQPIVSHRAGRLGFDERYAALLAKEGYLVDCSVTPGVDWRSTPGKPGAHGGPNYSAFPRHPYFFATDDIALPASDGLLEVPVTIAPSIVFRHAPWAYLGTMTRRLVNKLSPRLNWLCPGENDLRGMLRAARFARAEHAPCVEFMLHSSELMPGGSPRFRSFSEIERLYESLEVLFAELSVWCRGLTLSEFHREFTAVPTP
jgi:hypothetical protein